MKEKKKIIVLAVLMAGFMAFAVIPALAQDKPADDMQILRNRIKGDKRLLVAKNMELTGSEAKGFWPVYEGVQKDLDVINQRIVKLIDSYAADYQADSLTDEKAKKLTDELVSIEKAEAALKASFVQKLSKVLPPKKVARYLQIENKIRAVVKYELADKVPLVE
jgi:Spy/CpxP family protein refolding chaperone